MSSFGSRIVDLLPHYLVMITVIFGVLVAVEALYGELGFWASFVVAIAVAAIYPSLVRRVGIAPDAWRRE
ncbi:hypothetical protein [Halalkalicoccus jeotgali]|uniref:Uncharacterized protein n=1 Tax=Halalkalicoccus jeotgali (strain DSM 18796 / CECT 7217 / JCM 14584 / KCTC 4019 / B3) TaxID=795797 RepID=D8J4H6_HALJB|nr:hypothetical protein [Halalkalicoccus jeotgali]ADJ13538.1 hypothetical protein HacjB3_00725 [Halalkalicoccus jeotgali B3]ELY32987.1 hypothetical protein C497_18607 [Halalkalicoccus jeotgali B3]